MITIDNKKRKHFSCIIKPIWTLYSFFLPLFLQGITPFREEYVSLVLHDRNYVFRGSIPRNEENTFLKETLLATLEKRAEEKGGSFPKDYYFSIISLLTMEREDEYTFLRKIGHPLKRQKTAYRDGIWWTWWQVRAHYATRPLNMPLFQQEFDGEYLAFPRLINWIKKLYLKPLDKPHIIYVHCRHGRNRTTAVIAALLMNLFDMPLKEAWSKAEVKNIYQPEELYLFLSLYEEYLQSLSRKSLQNTHLKSDAHHPIEEMHE